MFNDELCLNCVRRKRCVKNDFSGRLNYHTPCISGVKLERDGFKIWGEFGWLDKTYKSLDFAVADYKKSYFYLTQRKAKQN